MLANEATKILHGTKAAATAEATAEATFKGVGIATDLPEIKVLKSEVKKGISFLDLLANNKIMNSKSEARRAISNKGLKINNVIINDEKKIINQQDFESSDTIRISYGKKKHYKIKLT